jgi:anti-anti-sigma factor
LPFATDDFEWRADLRETGLTLSFAGSLDDRAVRTAWPGIEHTVSIERTVVVLDLSEVGFVDRMGLRLLLRLQLLTEGSGSRLVLSRPSDVVQKLMSLVGIAERFEYLDRETRPMVWCPRCGRTLVPTLRQCPHCGSPL